MEESVDALIKEIIQRNRTEDLSQYSEPKQITEEQRMQQENDRKNKRTQAFFDEDFEKQLYMPGKYDVNVTDIENTDDFDASFL